MFRFDRFLKGFLALFVLSAAVVTAGCRKALPEGVVAWQASIAELDVCTRRKHLEAARCDACARHALEKRHPDAARLFRAVARSERIQEQNCLRAIRRLGGRYAPPMPVRIENGTVDQNIRTGIELRRAVLATAHGGIMRVLDENNRYAARLLIHVASDEGRQLMLFEAYDSGADRSDGPVANGYLVCPKCGYMFDMRLFDPFCPCCLTDSRDFIRFD